MASIHSISSNFIQVDDLNIHYLTAGKGEPVVLLHGWPTSSYLWRKIIEPLAKTRWVIAPDLLGFGKSDKPLNVLYTLKYQSNIIDGILHNLGVERTALVVHDIGGPIGLYWAVKNQKKLERLVILNTFLHPELPLLMRLLFFWSHTPYLGRWLASPSGIAMTMKLGVINKNVLTSEVISTYQAPFASAEAKKVLLKTVNDINLDELKEITQRLSDLRAPTRIIYGEKDIWLASETRKLKQSLSEAKLISIPDCSHFLQEDNPERLSELLVEFLSE